MDRNKLLAEAFHALSMDDSFFDKAIKKISEYPELASIAGLLKTVRTRGYVTDYEIAKALDCSMEEIHEIAERNPDIKENSFEIPAGRRPLDN